MKTCPPRQSKPFLFPAGEARTNLKDMIRIAIQSKGRLNEDSLALLRERHERMPDGSYTTRLFIKGPKAIAKKVGEEPPTWPTTCSC